MNDGRRLLLLGMHAKILDENFTSESIHVYDTTNSFGHHSDLGQDQGTFEPICSRQGYENGASQFLVGFKLYALPYQFAARETYVGSHSFNSLVVDVSFNECVFDKIARFNTENSILLLNELVTSVLRLSEDKIGISTYHNELIVM